MSRTLRILYLNRQGRIRMNFNWGIDPPITFRTAVIMSAGEAGVPWEGYSDMEPHLSYVLGDADIWVSNVSPHDGGVEFILHVDYGRPLDALVDLTVLGPRDQVYFP